MSKPPFTHAEYDARLTKVRASMEDAGLDALFVEDPSNMAWLTGYDGWSFYVHQGVIVLREGEPIWWGRRMDRAGAVRTVWMNPETSCMGYDDAYVQSTDRHAMQDLALRFLDLGLGGSRIGVEMENYYFSAKAYVTLAQGLRHALLVDATGLVNRCRTVKSEAEIALMRKAARISEAVIDAAIDGIAPGRRKNELVAEIMATAVRGVDEDWGDYAAIVPMLPSGPDSSAAHLTWNGDPFREGEATFFELSGCYRRYHAPLCRTVFLGTPPDDLKRAEAALIEGLDAGIDAARAGNTAGDVARALAAALSKSGIERSARCGYPVGLSYPPDWGERTISFREDDETPLEAGMTFHFMPGIWTPDWGLEITETILIRDDAPAEPLANRPRKLFVK